MVIANILLHPLLDLAERIVSYGKPGATVGVSGIISEQVFNHCISKWVNKVFEEMRVMVIVILARRLIEELTLNSKFMKAGPYNVLSLYRFQQ